MHEWDTVYCEQTDKAGLFQWDAIALPKKCPCSGLHFYNDFNERLKRFNPDLGLGFDIKNGFWVIVRWNPEAVTVNSGDKGLKVGYVHRFITVLYSMKWTFNRIGAGRENNFVTIPRDPGEWVFPILKRWTRAQMMGKPDWVRDAMLRQRDMEEEEHQAKLKAFTDGWANDVASIADRGNPLFVRTAIRVPDQYQAVKKPAKKAKKKAVAAA